jgi:glucose/arabinose dehydrogenase
MPFNRCSYARLYAGQTLLVFGVLVLATPLVCGQSSSSSTSQTVIADSKNNGLNSPGALAVPKDENVFIVDTGNNRVVEEPWNSSTKAYGAQTVVIGNLYSPSGVVVSTSGNVFVADTGNNRIVEIPWVAGSGTYGPATGIGSGLNSPHGVAVGANGDVYIVDTGNNRVVELPWDRSKETYGAQTTVGTNLLSPEAVAVGPQGKVYIANAGNSSVVEVPAGCTAATSCTTQTTVASQEANGLNNPTGVAVTPSGNLYIVDSGNNRVIELPWNASSTTYGAQKEVGAGLVGPKGVALDATGNVYIADTGNNRVIKIAQSGRNHQSGNNGGSRMRR